MCLANHFCATKSRVAHAKKSKILCPALTLSACRQPYENSSWHRWNKLRALVVLDIKFVTKLPVVRESECREVWKKSRIFKISIEFYQLFVGSACKNVPNEGFFVKFNACRLFRIFNSDLLQNTTESSCYCIENMRIPPSLLRFQKITFFPQNLTIKHRVYRCSSSNLLQK